MRPAAAPLLLLLSCSWAFQEVHDPRPPPRPPRCDDGYVYPLGDLAWASLGAFLIGRAWLCDEEANEIGHCFDREVLAFAIGLPAALVFTASAGTGFYRARQCARARDAWGRAP